VKQGIDGTIMERLVEKRLEMLTFWNCANTLLKPLGTVKQLKMQKGWKRAVVHVGDRLYELFPRVRFVQRENCVLELAHGDVWRRARRTLKVRRDKEVG
jgi:hypothetical protein